MSAKLAGMSFGSKMPSNFGPYMFNRYIFDRIDGIFFHLDNPKIPYIKDTFVPFTV